MRGIDVVPEIRTARIDGFSRNSGMKQRAKLVARHPKTGSSGFFRVRNSSPRGSVHRGITLGRSRKDRRAERLTVINAWDHALGADLQQD